MATGWGTQARSDRALPFWFVVRRIIWPHTLIGVAVTYVLYRFAPDRSALVRCRCWLGLILAIPLVRNHVQPASWRSAGGAARTVPGAQRNHGHSRCWNAPTAIVDAARSRQ